MQNPAIICSDFCSVKENVSIATVVYELPTDSVHQTLNEIVALYETNFMHQSFT